MEDKFRNKWLIGLPFAVVFSLPICVFAKDKPAKEIKAETAAAKMELSFTEKSNLKICKVNITAGEKKLPGIDVKFYVKRFYSLLPLIPKGKSVTTDDNGEASVHFPIDLPGDSLGTIVVIAKVEDDENYGSMETKDSVKWGKIISRDEQEAEWNKRSLSATGDRAPLYLLGTSGVIIILVWGTLFWVIYSLVRIKKAGKP